MIARCSPTFQRLAGLLALVGTGAAAVVWAQAPASLQRIAPQQVQVRGTRVTLTYDLAGPSPATTFSVSLEVKVRGTEQVVRSIALAGDAGAEVPPGRGKSLTWIAGRDIPIPQFESYEYMILATPVVKFGTLNVSSDPPGASVTLGDEPRPRGTTPLVINDLAPGTYRITFLRQGYMQELVTDVVVRLGETAWVTKNLTLVPVAPMTSPAPPTRPPPQAAKGGLPKWLAPVIGGAAAGGILAAKGGGGGGSPAPSACSFSLSQSSWSPSSAAQSGGTNSVTVNVSPPGCSNSTWTATNGTMSNSQTPLTVSPPGGTGTATVTVTLQSNNTGNPASGSVNFTFGSAGGATFNVTNQSPLENATNPVSGNSPTFAAFPGITVVAGQKLTIIATGSITTGAGAMTPIGNGTTAGSQARLPGAPAYGLVCGIGGQLTGDLFRADSLAAPSYTPPTSDGNTLSSTTAQAGGTLFCGMNAPNAAAYSGNSGSWTVRVIVGGS